MKKSLAILMCALAAFSLFGAGTSEKAQPVDSPAELLLWTRTGDAFVNDQVGKFMEQYPDIKVKVEAVGAGYGDLRTKFNLGLQSGELPDLSIAGWSGMGSLYDAGAIVDISTVKGSDELMSDMIDSFSKRCRYQGALIAVPYQCSAPVLYYNKTVLDRDGATVPHTFNELMTEAAKCVERNAEGTKTIYGFNTAADTNWYLIPAIYNYGGSFFDNEGNANIDSDAAFEVYSWWQQMVQKGILPQNQHGTAAEDFTNGYLAFFFSSCASYSSIKKGMEGNGYQLGVAPFPGEKEQVVNLGGNGIIMFTKDERKQQAAIKLISFLLQPQQYQAVVDKGYLPVTNTVFNGDYVKSLIANDSNIKAIYDQVKDIGIFIQHPAYSTATKQLASIVSQIETYPDSNIHDLLRKGQEAINEYMENAR